MKEYKRLTERDVFGNADIIGLSSEKLYSELCFSETNLLTKALNKLAELETKLENGTLIELPCAIGSTIYLVPSETQFRLNNIGESFKKHNRVYEMEVYQIYMNKNDYVLYNFEQTASALGSSFCETWFTTKAEAEAKLKEQQNER